MRNFRKRGRVFTPSPRRPVGKPTAEAIEEFLLSRRARPSTLVWYRKKLTRLAAACPELPVSAAQVDRFLAGLTCTEEGRDGYWRSFHCFFGLVCRRHNLPNPMGEVARRKPKRKEMRFLSPVELNHVLFQELSLRDRALLFFYVESGTRASEGIIKWRDIHPESLRVSVSGKTGAHDVPVTPKTLRLLEALRPAGAGPDDFVFLQMGRANPLTYSGIYQVVHEAMKRAGLGGPKLGPHTFRHTMADIYLARGGDPFNLQEILGHSTLAMVQEYIRRRRMDRIAPVHHLYSALAAAEEAGQFTMFPAAEAVAEAEEIVRGKGEAEGRVGD